MPYTITTTSSVYKSLISLDHDPLVKCVTDLDKKVVMMDQQNMNSKRFSTQIYNFITQTGIHDEPVKRF